MSDKNTAQAEERFGKFRPLSELMADENLEAEDIAQYALNSKTNDNILFRNICNLTVKYLSNQTTTLTAQLKVADEQHDMLRDALSIESKRASDLLQDREEIRELLKESVKKVKELQEENERLKDELDKEKQRKRL